MQRPSRRSTTTVARLRRGRACTVPTRRTAVNMPSAETAIQIAAGPMTRKGAARRAADSAPSVRRVRSTATGVVAAEQDHRRSRGGPAAQSELHEHPEEQHGARRMPGDVRRPLSDRADRDARDVLVQSRRDVGDRARGLAGTRAGCSGSRRARTDPSTSARLTSQTSATAKDASSSQRQRRRVGDIHAEAHGERAPARPREWCPARRAATTGRAAGGRHSRRPPSRSPRGSQSPRR